jgi:hypothetical protein
LKIILRILNWVSSAAHLRPPAGHGYLTPAAGPTLRSSFAKAFEDRTVIKRYLASIPGELAEEQGTIELALSKSAARKRLADDCREEGQAIRYALAAHRCPRRQHRKFLPWKISSDVPDSHPCEAGLGTPR